MALTRKVPPSVMAHLGGKPDNKVPNDKKGTTQVRPFIQDFPMASSTILKLGKIREFDGDDGEIVYGRRVTLKNGDNFEVWNKPFLKACQIGDAVIYVMRKTIKIDGTESTTASIFGPAGSAQDQFMPYIPQEVARAIRASSSHAKDVVIALINQGLLKSKIEDFLELYDELHDSIAETHYNYLKRMIIQEDFTIEHEPD